MLTIDRVAPTFVEMAHRIVWCTAASVDAQGRPRSRVLHPYWEWQDGKLIGWIATRPTPTKRAHISAHPYLSCNYWAPSQDTCVAECGVEWAFDDATRARVWEGFLKAPAPVGYDPKMIPGWDSYQSENFAALKLTPWRLRVQPGSVLLSGQGETLVWSSDKNA